MDGGLFGGGVWRCSAVNVASKANPSLEKGRRGLYTTERTDGAGILRWIELNQGACGVLRCSVVKRRNGAGVYRSHKPDIKMRIEDTAVSHQGPHLLCSAQQRLNYRAAEESVHWRSVP